MDLRILECLIGPFFHGRLIVKKLDRRVGGYGSFTENQLCDIDRLACVNVHFGASLSKLGNAASIEQVGVHFLGRCARDAATHQAIEDSDTLEVEFEFHSAPPRTTQIIAMTATA